MQIQNKDLQIKLEESNRKYEQLLNNLKKHFPFLSNGIIPEKENAPVVGIFKYAQKRDFKDHPLVYTNTKGEKIETTYLTWLEKDTKENLKSYNQVKKSLTDEDKKFRHNYNNYYKKKNPTTENTGLEQKISCIIYIHMNINQFM